MKTTNPERPNMITTITYSSDKTEKALRQYVAALIEDVMDQSKDIEVMCKVQPAAKLVEGAFREIKRLVDRELKKFPEDTELADAAQILYGPIFAADEAEAMVIKRVEKSNTAYFAAERANQELLKAATLGLIGDDVKTLRVWDLETRIADQADRLGKAVPSYSRVVDAIRSTDGYSIDEKYNVTLPTRPAIFAAETVDATEEA